MQGLRMLGAEDERRWVAGFCPPPHFPAPDAILEPQAPQLSLETRRLMSPLFFSSALTAKGHNSAPKPAVKKQRLSSSVHQGDSLPTPSIPQLRQQRNKSCAAVALMGVLDPEK